MKFYVILVLTSACFCCTSKKEFSTSATEQVKSSGPEIRLNKQLAENSKLALPGINFGITPKEYRSHDQIMPQGLGANNYFVRPLFDRNSQLFKIELVGLSRAATISDLKLWDDHSNLINFIKTENGTPKILSSTPGLNDVKPGEIKWTHSWSNISKRIKVGIAEAANGKTYEVIAWIYDQNMLESKEREDSLMMHPEKQSQPKKKRSRSKRKTQRSSLILSARRRSMLV